VKITKISPAVKTEGRYNVFVDEQYSFSLDELQLVDLGLKKGQEITEQGLDELKGESSFGKNYIRAVDLISRRLRSEREIRDYAFRKQWTKENLERVIERLYERAYLDDEKFARAFVNSRASRNISLKKLKVDLMKKGIRSDLIEKTLSGDNDFDELVALKKLVAKKKGQYDDERKLIAYLMRQGFRYDDVKSALTDQ
jgi:regulatory protein